MRGWLTAQRWLLLCLFLALALRIGLWISQPLHKPANDEVEYITVARDLLAGRGWVFYESYHWLRAPLYNLFLAGSLWLSGGDLWLAALPNILLSTLNVLLTYAIARELGGRRLALGAALLSALLLTNITFAALYMSETLFALLFGTSLWLLLRWRQRPRRRMLVLAGLAFGLAVLTRSAPLFVLPLFMLWIAGYAAAPQPWAWTAWRAWLFGMLRPQPILAAAIFALSAAATIAPWTIRNCVAYGSCILVETGLSYNLWAFSEPREDQATIFRVLESIPNPADRADEATRRGLERLREDPAILLRKIWPNWSALWRVKPIEDRFLQEEYRADPPPELFLTALVFDDLLYAVICVVGIGAVAALALRKHPAALLTSLWLLYFLPVTLITHGEGRYRHFLFILLIPFAAAGFAALRQINLRPWWRPALVGALSFSVAFPIIEGYPEDWAWRGTVRSAQRLAGDAALARGDLPAAERAYRAAIAADPSADGWMALAQIHRLRDEAEQERDAYRAARSLALAYPLPHLRLGEAYRRAGNGEAARAAFSPRFRDERRFLDWGWRYLTAAPRGYVAVGDGYDFGFVTGVYPAEELAGFQARWTMAQAQIRLPAASRFVYLRLMAPIPDQPSSALDICADGVCKTVTLDATWRTVGVMLPPHPTSNGVRVVELRSPAPFAAPDGRELGVVLDGYAGE